MASPELEAARKRLRESEARARRKMRRLDQQNRARVAGTVHDPTRGAPVERLNSRQIAARQARVEQFNSRAVQFHGDALGRILPKADVDYFNSVKRRYNREAAREFEKFKRIRGLDGQTVNAFHEEKAGRRYRTNRNYDYVIDVARPIPYTTKSFESRDKMIRKAKQYEAQLGEIAARRNKQAREEFNQMVDLMGWSDMKDDVNKLSNGKFELLWFHSAFIEELAMKYAEWLEARKHGNSFEVESDTHSSKAQDYVKWAASKKIK